MVFRATTVAGPGVETLQAAEFQRVGVIREDDPGLIPSAEVGGASCCLSLWIGDSALLNDCCKTHSAGLPLPGSTSRSGRVHGMHETPIPRYGRPLIPDGMHDGERI